MLAADRVVLLLSLVPYLREHGPTPLADLAHTFDVDPELLRKLVTFLGTAGIPGETLAYQHDDLFDIDWDLFEVRDVVALTQTVAIDETPRFTGVETAALLAGLNALQPLLPATDAALARALARRLASAFGTTAVPSVTVAETQSDERITQFVTAIEYRWRVRFTYRGNEGALSVRTFDPDNLIERESVWYVTGHDIDRDAERMFRVDRTSDVEMLETRAAPVLPNDPASETDVGSEHDSDNVTSTEERVKNRPAQSIIAVMPVRMLPAIRGFAPKVQRDLGNGNVQISVEAWHPGAAVRLVQHGPGEIQIVSPTAARAAVSEWAEAAVAVYGK